MVTRQFPCQPQKWLLEVVVRLGGNIVVLKILLAMEGDRLGLDFALLHVDFVARKDDRNVLADPNEVTFGTLEFGTPFRRTKRECLRCQFGTFL